MPKILSRRTRRRWWCGRRWSKLIGLARRCIKLRLPHRCTGVRTWSSLGWRTRVALLLLMMLILLLLRGITTALRSNVEVIHPILQ